MCVKGTVNFCQHLCLPTNTIYDDVETLYLWNIIFILRWHWQKCAFLPIKLFELCLCHIRFKISLGPSCLVLSYLSSSSGPADNSCFRHFHITNSCWLDSAREQKNSKNRACERRRGISAVFCLEIMIIKVPSFLLKSGQILLLLLLLLLWQKNKVS